MILGDDVGYVERPDFSDAGQLPEVLHDRLLAPEQPPDGVVVGKRVPPLDVLAQCSQQRTTVVPVERFVGLANPRGQLLGVHGISSKLGSL